MKKIILCVVQCAAVILCYSGEARAGVTNKWIFGDQVVYDYTNGTWWYPDLTKTTGMTRAQQEGFIASLNAVGYGGIKVWEMADYDQLCDLKDSLASMGTHWIEHEWPWTPPGTPRTVGSPFLAWPVQVDQFFTPTSVMTVGPPLVPAPILGGLPMQVFNGRITGWAWRTDVPAMPPTWEYGEADDHFVVSPYMTLGDFATMTFNYDVHYLPDDATDRLDDLGNPVFPGPIGTWIVSTTQPIPAPGAFILGVIGAGLVGWLRRRRTL